MSQFRIVLKFLLKPEMAEGVATLNSHIVDAFIRSGEDGEFEFVRMDELDNLISICSRYLKDMAKEIAWAINESNKQLYDYYQSEVEEQE